MPDWFKENYESSKRRIYKQTGKIYANPECGWIYRNKNSKNLVLRGYKTLLKSVKSRGGFYEFCKDLEDITDGDDIYGNTYELQACMCNDLISSELRYLISEVYYVSYFRVYDNRMSADYTNLNNEIIRKLNEVYSPALFHFEEELENVIKLIEQRCGDDENSVNIENRDKKVIIFSFDGTLCCLKTKFDCFATNLKENKRKFLPNLTDDEYEIICSENPEWLDSVSTVQIAKQIYMIKEKYSHFDISIDEFLQWHNDNIDETKLNDAEIIDLKFLINICMIHPTYIVSNSSLKHINYYMNKFGFEEDCFKGIYINEFNEKDLSKTSYYQKIIDDEQVVSTNIYVFGSNEEIDLEPARELRMNTILVKEPKEIPERFNEIVEI